MSEKIATLRAVIDKNILQHDFTYAIGNKNRWKLGLFT